MGVALNQQLAWGLRHSCDSHCISPFGVLSLTHHLWWAQTYSICCVTWKQTSGWNTSTHVTKRQRTECGSYRGSLTMPPAAVLKPLWNISQIWFRNVRHLMKLPLCQLCYRKRHNCSEKCNYLRYSQIQHWCKKEIEYWLKYWFQ